MSALAILLATTLLLLPVLVDPGGQDAFRLPKELLFRAIAILFALSTIFVVTRKGGRDTVAQGFRGPATILVLAGVLWTAVSTIFSTNIRLSVDSLITVVCSALLFGGFCLALRNRSIVVFDIALVAPSVNAVIAILQEYGVWQPFPLSAELANHPHLGTTALLGNPNDVGAFLVLPAVAAAVASAMARGHRRTIYGCIALLLLAGLVASATRTALIAYVIALMAAAIVSSRRAMLVILGLVVLAVMSVIPESTVLGKSSRRLLEAARTNRYDILFSERLPVFLAATEMFRDRPLTGQGPGTFKWHYMRYRVELAERYPEEWTRGWPMNFGETHNDHLQTLAETGLPGYAVMLSAAGVVLLKGSWKRAKRSPSFEGDFARRLRLPLVSGVLVLMLAQFPLQLAAPRMMILFLSALCLMWSSRES